MQSDKLFVRPTRMCARCSPVLGVTIAAMKMVASEINKMKRASFRPLLELCRVYLFRR